ASWPPPTMATWGYLPLAGDEGVLGTAIMVSWPLNG
ncbi:MAG: hypothetical protein QOE52_1824, partial [Mycobacterium sp.]|nr:hypothetical protein [Mycobacterium sp.]